jgi:hypothetical protein
MIQGAVSHSCATMMNAEFREFGFHVRGNDAWIVLAAPFMPPLAEQVGELEALLISLVNDGRSRARRCGDRLMTAAPPVSANARLRAAAAARLHRDGTGFCCQPAKREWGVLGAGFRAARIRPGSRPKRAI